MSRAKQLRRRKRHLRTKEVPITSHRDWLTQPTEIWQMICYSLEPVEQFKIRSNLRATCSSLRRRLNPPVSRAKWHRYQTNSLRSTLLLNALAPAHYLITHGFATKSNIMSAAAWADRLDILQNMQHPITDYVVVAATCAGSLRCLQFAHRYVSIMGTHPCESYNLAELAAKYGRLQCLRYVHVNGVALTSCARDLAARRGHVDCLRYIHQAGIHVELSNAFDAAQNGHLDCLIFISQCICLDEIILRASIKGGLECFHFVHKTIGLFTNDTCELAANHGQLDCLRYAHENGAKWDASTCRVAARRGNFDCLTYAHQHGCPLDFYNRDAYHFNTCQGAAEAGNIDCLRYAHENGVALNEFVRNSAKRRGNYECIAYVEKYLGKEARPRYDQHADYCSDEDLPILEDCDDSVMEEVD